MLISENKLRRIIRQELINENKSAIVAACLAIAASTAAACSDGHVPNHDTRQDLHSCVVEVTNMANQGRFNKEKLELAHKIHIRFNDAYRAGGVSAKVLNLACQTLKANPDR